MENKEARIMRHGQPFQFTWLAAREHRWVEARLVESPTGALGDPGICLVQAGSQARKYQPFQSATGIFRNFAALDLKRDAIQTFANEYGMLEERLVVLDGTMRRGEPEYLWFEQIREVRRWLDLWDAIQSGSIEMLKDIIKWRDKDAVMIDYEGHQEWIATNALYPELLPRFVSGELVQPALYLLQRVMNEKLEKYKSTPQLLWDNGKLFYFIRPQTLLAAIWLQFALAVDGDRQYRICGGCQRWFEIGGGAKRADSKTCDQTCRKRLERRETQARKEAEERKAARRSKRVRRIRSTRRPV
jgi:hypothetical protein